MENASKALIMAAGVLLGVMLISIGVYLFSIYGDYTSSMYARIEEAQINQFNTQFLKYYGTREAMNGENTAQVYTKNETCTVHDIASLANLAAQSNIDNFGNELAQYRTRYDLNLSMQATTNYIQIKVRSTGTNTTGISASDLNNLETWSEEKMLQFIKNNSLHTVYVKDDNR